MEEKTFFNYDGVRVTNTRFVVDGRTYAMSNVTSVSPFEQKPNRLVPAFLVIVGVALTIVKLYPLLTLSIVGIIWFRLQKTVYSVVLHTSGVETTVLTTYQKEYLQKVVGALNKAIVYRG